MGLRFLSLWLGLLCCAHCSQVQDDVAATERVGLNHVLEVEINATKQLLGLYKRKHEVLGRTIHQLQRQSKQNESSSVETASVARNPQRRHRPRDSPPIFSDWFEPQGALSLPRNSLTRLVSFRPNASPVGRRQQMPPQRKAGADDVPPMQFLLVLDPQSTVVKFFHPTTFELMWQHALDLKSLPGQEVFEVVDVFFSSERNAHLALVSTSGEVALFKLRLWHGRRVVSGDPRRLKPQRDVEEDQLQCAVGQDSFSARDLMQPPWLQQSTSLLTTPGPGRYLHVDVERVFGATLNREWQYVQAKVAVVALYDRVIVVVSDSSGGHLTFYNGKNGSFVNDVHPQISSHDGGVVHLDPIQSRGLVALVTRRRVLLVDASASLLLPVECEAPGRHTFTSLAVDPLRPSLLYVGTSTGRGLVYKLHNLGAWRQRADISEGETQGPVMCTLVDQLLPRRPPLPGLGRESPAIAETMSGFLLLGSSSRLVLYQLSGSGEEVHPTYLSERSLVDSVFQALHPSAPHPQVLAVSAAKDLAVHPAGFAVIVAVPPTVDDARMPNQRVDIYESRIPPSGTNIDLSWIRVPAMMICALAAMFWQQKGRLAYSAGGRTAFNEAELASMISGRGGP